MICHSLLSCNNKLPNSSKLFQRNYFFFNLSALSAINNRPLRNGRYSYKKLTQQWFYGIYGNWLGSYNIWLYYIYIYVLILCIYIHIYAVEYICNQTPYIYIYIHTYIYLCNYIIYIYIYMYSIHNIYRYVSIYGNWRWFVNHKPFYKNSVYCQQIFFLLSLFVIRQHYSPSNYTYTSYTVHIWVIQTP